MYRKSLKFMALFITILVAELLSDYFIKLMLTFKRDYDPYLYTLVGMIILVVIYYPLMVWADKSISKFSERFLRVGKHVAGRKFGIFIMFFVALAVLFYFFIKDWYKIDLLNKVNILS